MAFSIISIYKTVYSIIFHLTFSYLNDMICHYWSENYSFFCLEIYFFYNRLCLQSLETIALCKVSSLDDYFCRYVTSHKMIFCLYRHSSILRCKLLNLYLYDWREQVILVKKVGGGKWWSWCVGVQSMTRPYWLGIIGQQWRLSEPLGLKTKQEENCNHYHKILQRNQLRIIYPFSVEFLYSS